MESHPDRTVVGLISDTHGLLRPSVHRAFEGVGIILHAGDVGGQAILDELALIAPVRAARGNTDPPDDPSLENEVFITLNGVDIHVSHGHEVGAPTAKKLTQVYPQRIIVYGHTHRQLIEKVGDQLVVNPGAAGQRRFSLQPSVARLTLENGHAEVELVTLD